jgi:hypothetical protein
VIDNIYEVFMFIEIEKEAEVRGQAIIIARILVRDHSPSYVKAPASGARSCNELLRGFWCEIKHWIIARLLVQDQVRDQVSDRCKAE